MEYSPTVGCRGGISDGLPLPKVLSVFILLSLVTVAAGGRSGPDELEDDREVDVRGLPEVTIVAVVGSFLLRVINDEPIFHRRQEVG